MTTPSQLFYIIIYTGIKKEIITCKKGIDRIMEIYTENGLDINKFFHNYIIYSY